MHKVLPQHDLVRAFVITPEFWRELRLKHSLDEFKCHQCDRDVGIGDRVGYSLDHQFLGFCCKLCFDKVLEAQRMN